MRIAVFGTGAVGGYFGGRLAQAGEEVIFIARGENLKALRENGLRVESISGDFSLKPVHATDEPDEAGVVDAVLVCVKTWQVEAAARAVRPMVGRETAVVPLQNGVEAPGRLAEVLGKERVLGGLCGLYTYMVGPGHIRHAGAAPFIKIGELDNRKSERVERLRQALERAEGLSVEVPPDIHSALWQKFVLIAGWGGLGAVTRAPIGVIRTREGTRLMMERSMREILEVGRARGVILEDAVIPNTLGFLDGLPPNGTASMQRDLMDGRPSELEAQNGAVVRMGREAGVETPVNAFVYHSLLPMELRARGELEFEV